MYDVADWSMIEIGNVFPERMKREDSVSARARNYGEAGDDGDDNGDDEEAMNETKAARWWPDEVRTIDFCLIA